MGQRQIDAEVRDSGSDYTMLCEMSFSVLREKGNNLRKTREFMSVDESRVE